MIRYIKRILVEPIRWYCRYSPIARGKGSLEKIGLKILGTIDVLIKSKEKTKFSLSFPRDKGWECIYFRGTCEEGTSQIMKKLLRKESIVLDVGANIGWYTTLAARYISAGECHSFEPVPFIFNELDQNCEINKVGRNVFLNQVALGKGRREVEMYTFDLLPHGHASLSSAVGAGESHSHKAKMISLNDYMRDNNINKIDLIKIDVEGAELDVLEGGGAIFELSNAPIWIFEMNKEAANKFGNSPEDLLKFLEKKGAYKFCKIRSAWGELVEMKSVNDYAHGDNVICVPVERKREWEIIKSLFK